MSPGAAGTGHLGGLLTGLSLGRGTLSRRPDLRLSGSGLPAAPKRVVLLDGSGAIACLDSAGDVPGRPLLLAGDDAPEGTLEMLLGVDDEGTAFLARVVQPTPALAGGKWLGLRAIGAGLGDRDAGICTTAVALANWHATHGRCPRCGAPTAVAGMGWWRVCPQDGSEHHPRTDPAIIALVRDSSDQALLGRSAKWPPGAFSTLAGFVEPGETAEAAVVREIHEEVGITVERLTYLGSQPWPFPASLMLGYHAHVSGQAPRPLVDGTEIVEAIWLTREELPALCRSREVRLPSRISIANRLIQRWFGAELPAEWCRW